MRGANIVMLTPFKSSTEVDTEALRANTNWLVEKGVVTGKGVLIPDGTNGECFSMTLPERKRLMEVVVEEAAGRVPVCVGCNHTGTEQAIDLAKHAERIGADAVMILPPYYEKCPDDETVYAHFRAISDAVHIGIMIYNNPSVVGKDLALELLLRMAEIENIIALKECTSNFAKLREVIRHLKNRWAIIDSWGENNCPFNYQLGAVGFISLIGNFAPAYAVELHDISVAGDPERAQALYARTVAVNAMIDGAGPYRGIALAKEGMRLVGRPMGDYERLPLVRPSTEQCAQLRRLMVAAGFL
jgi:4-hydroxy-tetrahydrodipicolinate synthase